MQFQTQYLKLKPPLPSLLSIFLYSTKENLHRQCMEFAEDQHNQNVVYCETRICPHLYCEQGLSPEEVTSTILDSLYAAQNKYGVTMRLILCFLKPKPGDYRCSVLFGSMSACQLTCAHHLVYINHT